MSKNDTFEIKCYSIKFTISFELENFLLLIQILAYEYCKFTLYFLKNTIYLVIIDSNLKYETENKLRFEEFITQVPQFQSIQFEPALIEDIQQIGLSVFRTENSLKLTQQKNIVVKKINQYPVQFFQDEKSRIFFKIKRIHYTTNSHLVLSSILNSGGNFSFYSYDYGKHWNCSIFILSESLKSLDESINKIIAALGLENGVSLELKYDNPNQLIKNNLLSELGITNFVLELQHLKPVITQLVTILNK